MEEYRRSGQEGKTVLVGVDLHRFKCHVTVRTEDQKLLVGLFLVTGRLYGDCWIGIVAVTELTKGGHPIFLLLGVSIIDNQRLIRAGKLLLIS